MRACHGLHPNAQLESTEQEEGLLCGDETIIWSQQSIFGPSGYDWARIDTALHWSHWQSSGQSLWRCNHHLLMKFWLWSNCQKVLWTVTHFFISHYAGILPIGNDVLMNKMINTQWKWTWKNRISLLYSLNYLGFCIIDLRSILLPA